jgi:hypothetical protein
VPILAAEDRRDRVLGGQMAGRCAEMATTVGLGGEVPTVGALAVEVDAPAATRALAYLAPDFRAGQAYRGVARLSFGVEFTHAFEGRCRWVHVG